MKSTRTPTLSLTSTFDMAVEAVRALPEDVREAIGAELFDHVRSYGQSLLSEAQREEIRRRIANPQYAPKEKIDTFFARHGIAN
jgi:PhoPQ-activated pathogenicity-related protein